MVGSALHRLLRNGKVTRTKNAYWQHSEAEQTNRHERFFTAHLPGYFITPWGLQPKESEALKDNRRVLTVNDIDAWLTDRRRWLRRERPDQHKLLRTYFGSESRLKRLNYALSGFTTAIGESNYPKNSRTGLTWIFSEPNQLHKALFKTSGNRMIGYFPVSPSIDSKDRIKKIDFGDGTSWINETDPKNWLSNSSIEGLRELQQLSQRDVNQIKPPLNKIITSLGKSSNYDMNVDVLDRIDDLYAKIPLRVLLAENPNKDASSTINRLDRLGVLKLGALRLLSTQTYSLFQSLPTQFWNHVNEILDTKINQ